MAAKDLAWRVLPTPLLARAAWWKYWFMGEWEIHELARIINARNGLVIDVGANVGYYAYALQRLGKNVVAFEPDVTYSRRLESLLSGKVRIEKVALSDHAGTGVLRVPRVAGGSYGGSLGSLSETAVPDDHIASSYTAELRTLDSYGFRDVSFIKIDVEGHEESVLAGAKSTLNRYGPPLLIEIEDRHNPGGLERIAHSLAQLGYRGFFYFERRRHNLEDFKPEVHQLLDNVDAGSSRRRKYVNNFVFIRS